jgi:lysophospholipase L1-like esterase
MIDCMVVGDSIAVGVAMYRPECVSYSRGGWNSWQWNKDYLGMASTKQTKTTIISLGANDHPGVKTEAELRKMRAQLLTERVYWISPGMERKPKQQEAIEKIAKEYGDVVLPRPEKQMSPDGVHPNPAGYKTLASQTK